MHEELVAAVVPCYGYGRYLHDAVRSLREQHGGPPRIVVVDDGSPDTETQAALAELEDAPDVEVIRQDNAGVCAARNLGLAAADRPFVLCLDADDRLAQGALQALLPPLLADPSLGFTYGHQRLFGRMNGVVRFPAYDPLRLLDRHLIGVTALMRAEVVRDTGGFDASFTHYEDWAFWVEALDKGWHGLRVDVVALEYRRHGSGKLGADRSRYRAFRAQLQAKHPRLYGQRRELARLSDMSWAERLVYRRFWGPRPVPAAAEALVARLLWPS